MTGLVGDRRGHEGRGVVGDVDGAGEGLLHGAALQALLKLVDAGAQIEYHIEQRLALVGIRVAAGTHGCGALGAAGQVAVHDVAGDGVAGVEEGDLLDYVLELAHVAGPRIVLENYTGTVVKLDGSRAVGLGKGRGEAPRHQHDVGGAVAQGRHVDLYRRQAVEQVFAEFALGYRRRQVDVGGGHNAHVGALHLARAHLQKFARLQHPQQARLGGEGQLGHLVKEDGAAVSLLEIALAGGHGAGERPLLVAEQLRVDGALGDGAAVDGDIAGVLAGRVLVYNLGKELLTRATLADYQHRQVDRCHHQRTRHRLVEGRRVADDAKTLLGARNLGRGTVLVHASGIQSCQ